MRDIRNVQVRCNLTEGEVEQLRLTAEMMGVSRTEVIAQGIGRMNAYALGVCKSHAKSNEIIKNCTLSSDNDKLSEVKNEK